MKTAIDRRPRRGVGPPMLLLACLALLGCARPGVGLVGASSAEGPATDGGSGGHGGTSSVPRSDVEHDRAEPWSAAPGAATCTLPNRNDLICEVGVDEMVPLPRQPCPTEMATIGGYCIDRWEAHLVERDARGATVPYPHYLRPREGFLYEARSAPGVFPQAFISRVEAQAACEAAGKRLCTWIEWRRGCQGPEWRTYPYGWAYREGACNHYKEHLLGLVFGENPRLWKQEYFDDPRLGQEPGFLARTAEYEGCLSPDGIYDAVGNLHEWVIDRVTVPFVQRLAAEEIYRRKQPWREGNGMFLGGFYSTRRQHGPGCHYTTIAHGPTYHDYSTGFRCCRDARGVEDGG